LTSVLQNFSRSTKVAVDRLSFEFQFKPVKEPLTIQQAPDIGCFVYGLYIEAANFDWNKMVLIENPPGMMHNEAPVIHFVPKENYTPDPTDYECPLYKTMTRSGNLSATGHSTNHVLNIMVPTPKIQSTYWT